MPVPGTRYLVPGMVGLGVEQKGRQHTAEGKDIPGTRYQVPGTGI